MVKQTFVKWSGFCDIQK